MLTAANCERWQIFKDVHTNGNSYLIHYFKKILKFSKNHQLLITQKFEKTKNFKKQK